jgi:RNA polymerase sigma-70 factor (ECF subfamily)
MAAEGSVRERAGEPLASLADLGRMARAGCARALDGLLRQVEGPVYRYLLARLRAAPDAEDLARDLCQEVLIRAMMAIPRSTFASDGRLLSWALTIARNVLLDHLRRARGRGEVRGDDHWGRVESGGAPASDDAPPPRLLEVLAAEALAQVPEATAELLRLRLVGGRSWKEVAETLGIAESAAKRRFQRVQAALRRKILARLDALPCEARHAAARRLPEEGAAFRSPGEPSTARQLQLASRSPAGSTPQARAGGPGYRRGRRTDRGFQADPERSTTQHFTYDEDGAAW